MHSTPPGARRKVRGAPVWDAPPDDPEEASWASGERSVVVAQPWSVGQVVADRYRLERLIGEGGMSRVFAAHDLSEGREVALKLVSFDRGDRTQLEARFKREIEVAMQLSGSPFVRVHDHGLRADCAYIAMDLLIGESLQERLSRVGKLDLFATLSMLRGVARGLAIAHELCIVHRDLKPSNVFFAVEDDAEVVRLLDFGIAKDLWTSAKLTQAGVMLGSPHYVSPEQAKCSDLDHRSDLWSLAVILYRCLTGHRPFDGQLSNLIVRIVTEKHQPPSRLAALPPAVDAFFERALAKRPEDRFQDVASLVEALETIAADGLGVESQRLSISHRSTPVVPHRRVSDATQLAAASYETYAAQVTRSQPSLAPAPVKVEEVSGVVPAPSLPRPADDQPVVRAGLRVPAPHEGSVASSLARSSLQTLLAAELATPPSAVPAILAAAPVAEASSAWVARKPLPPSSPEPAEPASTSVERPAGLRTSIVVIALLLAVLIAGVVYLIAN